MVLFALEALHREGRNILHGNVSLGFYDYFACSKTGVEGNHAPEYESL